jgi:hypothetical protein
VNTVVFDKTGTLTRGRPQVTEAVLFNSHYTMQQVRFQLAARQHVCSTYASLVVDLAQSAFRLLAALCGRRAGQWYVCCRRSVHALHLVRATAVLLHAVRLLDLLACTATPWATDSAWYPGLCQTLLKTLVKCASGCCCVCAGVSACCCSGGV